jgi:hypothetical protein
MDLLMPINKDSIQRLILLGRKEELLKNQLSWQVWNIPKLNWQLKSAEVLMRKFDATCPSSMSAEDNQVLQVLHADI